MFTWLKKSHIAVYGRSSPNGRIPGSKKKKMWIREGDVVIANPWEVQDSKADVTWKYTRPQIEWLERKGYLN